ncbi:EcoAI/FtnUII family type I restriction enzme subunit R [Xanthomonas campestris]|uniref:EcoAI/FtnUII family type I restriction enzme subunit R n=1 Tax=Xanthomonas campestris TaxID=339 RepID=UPI0023671C28|nr:DEAD/DEAH box helicase family protein [Xanthomonas campestris]MEA9660593.1 DEAD/DEAH box helicase family protein [Xanthomonas campestris pv. raphani]MEA9765519.1 DEAD/DEAH box helicase family protein [Xanthomonas campestris pv. raphani]MEA9784883.1 DEAD/DEAH box helicase family protein [Xanthomonas campestris pv. raphani]MEA9793258.1 DEAD/DEAH box helicase family protein [Xanthomonas campestris pv. raphani]MEA9804676.1 DEAD/DEAH box helicase family protein [Xanthomonas campestris pv. raphan
MDKSSLTERDICTKFIIPSIVAAGWDLDLQVREEVAFTKGRVVVRGKLHSRGLARRADFVLYHRANLPLAVIEAKDNKHSVGSGMQQALGYADALDVPFVFSSNGDGFLFHDRTATGDKVESELTLDQFPSPEELWRRYCLWKGLGEEARQVVESPYYDDGSSRSPRYYQINAINRTIEAVANGQNRILLVMATGTGKTYTAFQIIWRLWKSRQKKRILFLADRNILVDQTKNNDFKPFGTAMTKITKRQIDTSYEIYLSLYQAVTGVEDVKNIYKQFSREFFDLVVIDECHRGSAAEDSAWREILEYFSGATHIGLTATPKETKEVSSSTYFGEPVYSYTLKQGIDDGFLAPYKVVRIDFDVDLQGWRPPKGMRDKNGELIEDRIYNLRDMDRQLVVEARTYLVAQKVTEFLTATGPFQKTIVFCDDIDHAERMRQALVNLNPQRVAENRKYVMRITGDDNEGKAELDNFINPEMRYPVIATTSKLMTTGVDAQTCKLIVLDQHIRSMTEFKQIIGRGTRINEDYGKYWFTIMDFKKATELFADPSFDGDPEVIYNPSPNDSPVPPEIGGGEGGDGGVVGDPPDGGDDVTTGGEDGPKRIKYVIDKLPVSVVAERVLYYGSDGKLITESLRDYTRERVLRQFASLDDFLRRWSDAQQKKAIIDELATQGVLWEELAGEVEKKLGQSLDPFDLICHVAFDQPPLSRRERADGVRKRNYFARYQGKARQVLEGLLDKYADTGVEHIEDIRILQLDPFRTLGAPVELVAAFGGKTNYQRAILDLESQLYSSAGVA